MNIEILIASCWLSTTTSSRSVARRNKNGAWGELIYLFFFLPFYRSLREAYRRQMRWQFARLLKQNRKLLMIDYIDRIPIVKFNFFLFVFLCNYDKMMASVLVQWLVF